MHPTFNCQLSQLLQSIAAGDLTARMDGQFNGVFARMRDDANTTVAQLTQIVGQIQASASSITLAAGEIARRLDVPPNTLSSNLNILSHADLIESRRDGRSIIYTARYANMTELLEFLMQDCCDGSPEICAPLASVAISSRCIPEGQA